MGAAVQGPCPLGQGHLFQLAAYRVGVGRIFPGLRIEAAILWTDGPRFMPMPPELLDAYQARLWEQAPG